MWACAEQLLHWFMPPGEDVPFRLPCRHSVGKTPTAHFLGSTETASAWVNFAST